MIKLLLPLLMLTSIGSQASEFNVDEFLNKTSIYVGAGYKFQEKYYKPSSMPSASPISARFGITYQYSEHVSFGIDHHSQWLTGFPVNTDKDIYSKTEIFIDYKFTLSDVFN